MLKLNALCRMAALRLMRSSAPAFCLLLFVCSYGYGQTKVSGRITDAGTGSPLPSVTIGIKGSSQGTVSDASGHFSIQASSTDTLVISFVGYVSQVVYVGGKTNLNVKLKSSNQQLSQLVVVGYGTQKKATMTGSIAEVKGSSIQKSPAPNVSNSLSGRLPGLVVVTRQGQPGDDESMLRIRGVNTLGNNSPLVVVDGIAHRSLSRIDPANIESITVLKDASAAIYGSEAANGVILVTTKRGKSGKPQLLLNLSQAWNRPTVLPKMADAASYAQMINEIKMYAGEPAKYSAEDIQKYKDGSDPWGHPNTDWFKETIKPWSPQRYANLSLSGGTERVKYFVSGGYNYEDGIFYNSATNYSQVDFRSNIDAKISDNIHISVDLSGRQENANYPGSHGQGSNGGALSPWWGLNRQYPYLPAYWPNGKPGPDVEYGQNPVLITTNATGYDKNKTYIMQGDVKVDIVIPGIKGLSVTGEANYDKSILNHKQFEKPWYVYTWDGQTRDASGTPVLIKGERGVTDPRLWQSMTDGDNSTLRALINYSHNITEKHHFKLLLGTERTTGKSMNFNAYRRYFVSTAIDQMFAGGDLLKDNGGDASHDARLSYFGRLNYDYKGKYLAEFLFRYDGSYVFPEASRFGFFPGISLGWRISEEDFWKNTLPFINELKIRGSWGQTGNDRIDPYQFAATYGFNGTYILNQNVPVNTSALLRTPNPNITWEVANQSNIGMDGQMFSGKVSFSLDYFYNVRSNILWWKNASVPATAGISLPQQNFAKVSNQGFEVQVGYHNHLGEFKYAVTANIAYAKNKILNWDEPEGVPKYQQTTGHPMNSQLYYQAIGIFRDSAAVAKYPHWDGARPGDIIFKDVNGDGQINGLDQVREYKTDVPTLTGGAGISLEYKNFDASILIQGAAGAVRSYAEFSGEAGNFRMDNVVGRWTPENKDAKKPRAWNRALEYWMTDGVPNNTYWVRSSNYMRLKNMEIGYSLPHKLTEKIGIENLRVYASGLNLYTITPMVDFDPESPSSSNTSTDATIWVNSEVYPLNKTINFGLSVTF
jgi:TonB-linked SusC/RagA family outer membrane protein